VCEVLQGGYTNLTPLCQQVVINGANQTATAFRNDPKTYCIEGYKIDNCTGRGYPDGWNISVKNATAVVVANVTTDANGHYKVCGLLPGNYTVCEVLQPGWTNLTALCTPANITNANLTNVNFTNTRLLCISGYKRQTETGLGLSDWNVTVSNQSGPVAKVKTNATGYYQVCNLVPGNYTVCEELRSGWMNITPICVDIVLTCANATVDFENDPQVVTYCIDGYKIDNCTGQGLQGWNITVRNVTGTVVGNTTTNAKGWYQVCGLVPGNYTVCEVLQPGWTNLTALCKSANITTANVTNVNFTNTRLLCIEGRKINGTTGTGLANWNITVNNQTGQVAKVMTNATGYYKICNLKPGSYTVCEELKSGWINLTPSCVVINLNCLNATNINFNNIPIVPNGSISGYKINQSCNCTIPSWTIRLYNATTGYLVSMTKTDATGKYSFTGLPFGSYWVNESPQEAWAAVTPPHVQVNITMQNPYAVNINFTNFRSFTCNSSDVIIINGVEKHVICIWDP
jgi:protocatechuate 3,4-dioxygenase beta subunit